MSRALGVRQTKRVELSAGKFPARLYCPRQGQIQEMVAASEAERSGENRPYLIAVGA